VSKDRGQGPLAALARLTAAETGTLTPAASDSPRGFCLAAVVPGQQVCLDTFYVGRLKGVGAVWQFTAVDVATRWAIAQLIVGDKTAQAAAQFLDHLQQALADLDVPLVNALTDNGPEFAGKAFTRHAAELGIGHLRIPPRSPNHNAVCERFQGAAQEFYRRFFHRVRVDNVHDLDQALQGWLERYNTRRRNRGDDMRGHTPLQMLTRLRDRIAA
jgi:transposase InsO family protein